MKTYKVTFSNDTSFITSMNVTLDEAKQYYINNKFQTGDTDKHPKDNLIEGIKVEEV